MVKRDWSRFEEYAHKTMEEQKIPGMSVAVAENGEIVYAKGFGLRNRATGEPVTPETIFGIASVSKSFTALAIMQLADAGKLRVDDPVVKHLPEFRIRGVDWLEDIKIHHLMSHTTGLPPLPGLGYAMRDSMKGYPKWDDSQPEPEKPRDEKIPDLSTFDEYLQWLANEEIQMLGRPGEYFSYSNDCYCIMGAIIERVTGRDYYEYMVSEILGPIGMERSTFSLAELAQKDNVTRLYFNNIRRETLDVPQWQDCKVYDAGGGIRSTALDLVKYGQVYTSDGMAGNRRIVSAEGAREMRKLVYKIARRSYYGYGFQVTPDYSGVTLVEHGGSLTGVSSNFGFVPEKGLSVAVLTNVSAVPAAEIWLCAVNTALGLPLHQKRSEEPRDFQPPPGYLDRYVGTYKSGEGANIKIFKDADGVKVEIAGEQFPMRASDQDTLVYEVRGQERVARFYTDKDQNVWAMFHGLRMIRKVE